jgi:hypothetical protein
MAIKTISATYSIGYTIATNYTGVDVTAGGSIGGSGLFAADYLTLTNLGAIDGTETYGVDLSAGGDVTNGSASETTALIEGVTSAIFDATSVTNYGTIEATGAAGIGIVLDGAGTVTNFGTIIGTGEAVDFGSSSDVLVAEAGSHFVGMIRGGDGELEIDSGGGVLTGLGSTGTFSGSASGTFSGFGSYVLAGAGEWTITGYNTLAYGEALVADGTLDNTGSIFTKVSLGLGATLINQAGATIATGPEGVESAGAATVANFGLIEGTYKAIDSSLTIIGIGVLIRGEGDVTNSGTIIGGVFADGGEVTNGGIGDYTALIEGWSGVQSGSYGVNVDNFGTIDATGVYGVITSGDVINGSNSDTSALIESDFYGVRIIGSTLTNYGTIDDPNSARNCVYVLSAGDVVNGSPTDKTALIVGDVDFGRATGTLLNYGTITGGVNVYNAGIINGSKADKTALIRGPEYAVNVGSQSKFINYGTIEGENAAVEMPQGTLTNEASGLLIGQKGIRVGLSSTVVNYGTVDGTGGTAVQFLSAGDVLLAEGGSKFIGSLIGDSGTLELLSGSSAGTIDGMSGFTAVTFAADASWVFDGSNTVAPGLQIEAGTVEVAGTLEGATYAIEFIGNAADRLTIDPGAVFVGKVVGGGEQSVLELAAADSAGTLSGLGVRYLDFGTIAVDAGASWDLTGAANTIESGTTLVNSGTFIDLGTLAVAAGASLTNDGVFEVNGGSLILEGGFSGSGIIALSNGGTVDATDSITGVTLDFTGLGRLDLAQSGGYGGVSIEGFGVGDVIDLTNITYQPGDTVTYRSEHLYLYSSAHALLAEIAVTEGADVTGFEVTGGVGSGTEIEAFCFMAGTLIGTPEGEVEVEALRIGDLVTTANGGAAPIRWIGRQTVATRFGDALRILPIRIEAGAIADNLPVRDLLCSPDHAVLIDGVLVQAGALVNFMTITRETNVPETFVYYHIELDGHDLILAEGLPAETFVDNVDRLAFDNWQEHLALFPEGKTVVELPQPRAKAHRQVPAAVRERLRTRAAQMKPGGFASVA